MVTLTFTDDFYKKIYRLWGLPFIPKYIKNKPSCIGKLTTKYIYEMLPKGVLDKIKEKLEKRRKAIGNINGIKI
ncbi:P63C domain-containing protein [uncultured Chryseobacterium sp.]|uniref:P63C domain-containing protein n=1 Tax=uncultured Chryseobacterium sp. TaxID=259322 RepID=UPI00338E9AB0